MKVPTELLGDHFDGVRPGGRGMQVKRGPNSLAHDRETDENNRGHDGPNNFQPVVAVRIRRAGSGRGIAILPHHPTKSDLSCGESNPDHNDGDLELVVNGSPVLRDGFREPPMFADKHSDRAESYQPDSKSKNASHQFLLRVN
jgi:hypothetical protein